MNLALLTAFMAALSGCPNRPSASHENGLSLRWEKSFLYVHGQNVPGGEVEIHYLEAYCRPGSTKREWGQTVIPHLAELLFASPDGKTIKLRDTLRDGVIVEHTIQAREDEVDFQLEARNPTKQASEAHWAQPCMRVDRFTGCSRADARSLKPKYASKCFLFIGGKSTRLPTDPWADKALYTPGQVYCPVDVNREDVNPRPLSALVPSHGLTGCFSADEKKILAIAWDPYQEIFQGVIACMHADFRIGGLQPGETKRIHGKLYVVDADADALFKRYLRDFPTQASRQK
jgi:hypothetical protein